MAMAWAKRSLHVAEERSSFERFYRGFLTLQRLLFVLMLTMIGAELHAAAPGQLIIVGGALDRDNTTVFRAFIDRVADGGSIALIGAASGSPASSMAGFAADLVHHGVDPARVVPIALAWRDDSDTTVDESTWRDNASDAEEVARIRRAGGIWFTGGDQSRITRILLADDGSATPMLEAMRERLAEGIVIGGTSAGAAVMSDPMVSGGDNLPVLLAGLTSLMADEVALPLPQPGTVDDINVLSMGAGLGFLPGVLLDQHFDARARLGRLVMALLTRPPQARVGIGIDENTGVAIDLGSEQLEVLGAASITLVDARDAVAGVGGVRGLRLSVLAPGSRVNLLSFEVTAPDWQLSTAGAERFDRMPVSLAGVATPAGATLGEQLGEALLDNVGAGSVDYLSFRLSLGNGADAGGQGVVYRFRQKPESRGYRGLHAGSSHYSVVDLAFDVELRRLVIEPAAAIP